jgi:hypothetical protein
VLAEPVLKEIEPVGGLHAMTRTGRAIRAWGMSICRSAVPSERGDRMDLQPSGRHMDPDAGKPHPSAAYFKNRGRWNWYAPSLR